VFKHFVLFTGDEARNRNPNITVPFDVAAKIPSIELFQRTSPLVRCFALRIAVFLLLVNSAARFAAFWIYTPTFKAAKSVFGFTRLSPTYSGTLARAVQRVASIFFTVRGKESFQHRKFFIALATSEFDNGSARRRDSFVETVGAAARKPAVLPAFARVTSERLLAIFTDFFNRHRSVPLFGDRETVLLPIGNVK
jgi:hypothetical protein